MKTPPLVAMAYFRQLGAGGVVDEYRFHPTRKWRFDYAWPAQRVALEVEGGCWVNGRHSRGSGKIKDMEKYSAAAVLGWRLLYVTPQQLMRLETVAMIKQALAYSAHDSRPI